MVLVDEGVGNEVGRVHDGAEVRRPLGPLDGDAVEGVDADHPIHQARPGRIHIYRKYENQRKVMGKKVLNRNI